MLYTQQPKKLMILNILEILKKYTDADHRLSQKEIVAILKKDYDMAADRKSIKRNLMSLVDAGYPIEYSETVRINKNGEEEIVYSDWYLENDFSDAELRLLIDSILSSRNIPQNQYRELIGKIEGLSNKYFHSKMRHVRSVSVDAPKNPELMLTIEVLDEAIEQGRQVVFHYADFGIDKKLHNRTNADAEVREYLVNPYQMAAANGRYYLLCNYDKYDTISHYRIDHIRDIRMLETPVKPAREVKGMEHGLDLPKHMAEHVYMFAGESQRVSMRVDRSRVGDVIDWFGNSVWFTEEPDSDTVLVQVTVNLAAMRYWALQYAPYVTVLSPQSLVDDITDALAGALERYKQI